MSEVSHHYLLVMLLILKIGVVTGNLGLALNVCMGATLATVVISRYDE